MTRKTGEERSDEAIAFALQLLGGELVAGEAAEGTMLWHLERLGALVEEGKLTEDELHAALGRLEEAERGRGLGSPAHPADAPGDAGHASSR